MATNATNSYKFSVFFVSAVSQLATLGISCEPSDRHQRLQGVESWGLPAMPFACFAKQELTSGGRKGRQSSLETHPMNPLNLSPNKIPKRTLVF